MVIPERLRLVMPIKQVGARKLPPKFRSAKAEAEDGQSVLSEEDIEHLLLTAGSGAITRTDDTESLAAEWIVMRASLRPSECIAYHVIRTLITPELEARIADGHYVCAEIRLPQDWSNAIAVGLTAALHECAVRLGCADVRKRASLVLPETFGRRKDYDADGIAEFLVKGPVAIGVFEGDEIGEASMLVDVRGSLVLDPERLLIGIRHRFPEARWPDGLDATIVTARNLDLAVRRASSEDHLWKMLHGLGEAYAENVGLRKKEEQPATAAKKDGKPSLLPRGTQVQVSFPTAPKVEDLHGYGSAAGWAGSLAADIADFREGLILAEDLDRGCVLHGPPGTGKTLLASAIAASAGVAFIPTSYADWQSRGAGHAGDVVKAIKAVFEEANKHEVCIVFIDEIDTVPGRGTTDRHDDWWTMIVAALLECLDGTNRREGVIVLGACNHVERLDPALVRSGRLDRRFEIGLPGEEDLVGIFGHHLPDVPVDSFQPIATALAGSISGADVAKLAREARRAARREKRDLLPSDLLNIALPPETRPASAVRRTAIHEAGHAVVQMVQGRTPRVLTLVRHGSVHGGVVSGGAAGDGMGTLAELEAEVVFGLAGRAAEEVILGDACAGSGGDVGCDLDRVTTIVRATIGVYGLGGRLTHDTNVPASDVENRLRDLYGRTLRLVSERRADIEALAALAMERRVLSHRALLGFARERGLGGEAGR